jgi:hypothetical protein
MKKNHRHKHMILLMNKCDLVPAWVTKRWLHTLSREYPTLAFHASQTGAFGKGALLSVLRQLARLKGDKSGISVGFVVRPPPPLASHAGLLGSFFWFRSGSLPVHFGNGYELLCRA